MAKLHGMANIAVIEKGWLGGGNTGRNTTIVRSNYLCSRPPRRCTATRTSCGRGSEPRSLNYNVMFSPRGVMMLAHNHHDEQTFRRHVYANRLDRRA